MADLISGRWYLKSNVWKQRGYPDQPAFPVGTILDGRVQVAELTAQCPAYVPPVGGGGGGPDTFVLGTTKPSVANTGVNGYAAINGPNTLQVVNGNVTLSTPGQVYEGKDVRGYVYIRAANVTIRNCRITVPEPPAYVSAGIVEGRSSAATNCLVEFCTIRMTVNPVTANQKKAYYLNGVDVRSTSSVTVSRCDIGHVVDGVNASDTGNKVRILGSYIHDLAFYSNSPNQANSTPPGWTHNDGMQLLGGANHYVEGTYFESTISREIGTMDFPASYQFKWWGSGVTVSPNPTLANGGPKITGNVITRCWFEYGSSSFQANDNGAAMNFGEISESRFGMDQFDNGGGSRYQIRYAVNTTVSQGTTNYFDPDAPSVPLAKKGVKFTVGFTGGIRIG